MMIHLGGEKGARCWSDVSKRDDTANLNEMTKAEAAKLTAAEDLGQIQQTHLSVYAP